MQVGIALAYISTLKQLAQLSGHLLHDHIIYCGGIAAGIVFKLNNFNMSESS
jgi:hypothetical protein